mgnify:CR=1 FL=1
MMEDHISGPYSTDFEPALPVGAFVELLPGAEVREVTAVEVLPTIETQEITVPANDSLEEVEMRQLYAQNGVLAQFRLPDPTGGGADAFPDGVRITVDHGGEESPRFNLKNARGFYSNETPRYGEGSPQTDIFEWEDTDLFFNVENTTGSEVSFTLQYSGWAYKTEKASSRSPDISVLTERFSLRR